MSPSQSLTDSNGAATPCGGGKLSVHSLNVFDFASLVTSFERVVTDGFHQGFQAV